MISLELVINLFLGVVAVVGIVFGGRAIIWKNTAQAEKARADSYEALAKERGVTIEEERQRLNKLEAQVKTLQGRPDYEQVAMLIEASRQASLETIRAIQEQVAEQGKNNLSAMLNGVEKARKYREGEHKGMLVVLEMQAEVLAEIRDDLKTMNERG